MSKSKYSFQEDAIRNIINDFKKDPYSKNLLVIPTGGGKTLTAIKTVNHLIENGFLNKGDKVMWTCHLLQLKSQTEKAINNKWNKKQFNFNKNLSKILRVEMISEATKILNSDQKDTYKLLIIDEAHHSAANSYKNFFTRKIGILGLTATPTRMDDSELEFNNISYSITFRELVKRNVIIQPEFHSAKTGTTINATSLNLSGKNNELDKFNTEGRNQFIADEIFKRREIYKKVIIFVSSNQHVKDLYEVIRKKNKFKGDIYKHIGYIYSGNNNELAMSNEEYLEWHKTQESSILVNCKLLNEGYDDPSINTIVMAVPTRSILYYVQCIGRAVRTPQINLEKAYVLELVDYLPNIKYRIDNRWLFADISDNLEPEIIEKECYDQKSFKETITKVLKDHSVDKKNLSKIPEVKDFERVSFLLFNSNTKVSQKNKWKVLFIQPENRLKYTRIFNIISNNIQTYYKYNHEKLLFDILKVDKEDEYFKYRNFRVDFLTALNKANEEILDGEKINRLKYFLFTRKERYPIGFLEFIEDCHNREELRREFNYKIQNNFKYILKFQLVLGGNEGYYATEEIYNFCNNFISILQDIKENSQIQDHEKRISESISLLDNVPLPIKFIKSMIYLVKGNKYSYCFNI